LNKNLSKNILSFNDNSRLQILCGIYHQNLDIIEKKLKVTLRPRGNIISIEGRIKNILITKNALSELYKRAKFEKEINKEDVEAIINFMKQKSNNNEKIKSYNQNNYYIKTSKGTIYPRPKEQVNLIKH